MKKSMMIQEFDRTNVRTVTNELESELQAFAEKYGLKVVYRGARFSDVSCNVKLELQVTKTKSGKSASSVEFAKFAPYFGLKASDFGKSFRSNGEEFWITGIKARRSRYPVIAAKGSVEGRRYKFSAETVQQALGRKPAGF